MTAPPYPPCPPQLSEQHLSRMSRLVRVYLQQSSLTQVQHRLGSGMARRTQVQILRRWRLTTRKSSFSPTRRVDP